MNRINRHLLREDLISGGHYHGRETETCSAPPQSVFDQWVLPVTLLSSLVCCVVLVVDVTLRLRNGRKEHGRRRSRSASANIDYSIDDFECLDMGTGNMLFHLQNECNDISAKIDRCAMALVVTNQQTPGENPNKNADRDLQDPEELSLSPEEIFDQWENLRWFQEFACLHTNNAFLYQQYHTKLVKLGLGLEEEFGKLHHLLLQNSTDAPTKALEDIHDCLGHLNALTTTLDRLVLQSTKVIPLHRRIKFTGRQEALKVIALCDYSKEEFNIRLGEPLTLVWRKNKHTWRVRNAHNVEGYLPAICCLIPGPDPDTMEHAQGLADEFSRQWHAFQRKCEKKLCLYTCYALAAASLKESHLVVLTDTNRAQARETLSLVERVMTSDPFHHVISEADRKSSQGILHQLYELLNGCSAREETSSFLEELQRCHRVIQIYQKQVDLVVMVNDKSQTLSVRIAEEKGRKRSLTRQSSSPESGQSTAVVNYQPPETEAGRQNKSPTAKQVTDDVVKELATANPISTEDPGNPKSQSVKAIHSPTNNALNKKPDQTERSHQTNLVIPTIRGFNGPKPVRSVQTIQEGNAKTRTPHQLPIKTAKTQGHDQKRSIKDSHQESLKRRSTVMVSNSSTGPGQPKTPIIAPRLASVSSNVSFGDPSSTPAAQSSDNSSPEHSSTGRKTDDEKLRVGNLQRSASVSSFLSTSNQGSRSSQGTRSPALLKQDIKMGSKTEISPPSDKHMFNSGSSKMCDKWVGTTRQSSNTSPSGIGNGNSSKPERPRTLQTRLPNAAHREHTTESRRMKHSESVTSTKSSTASTPQSPMSPGFYSCTSTPASVNSSFSQDVSLSLSLSSDEEDNDHQDQESSPVNEVFMRNSPEGTKLDAPTFGVPTITVLWNDEQSTTLSSFVAFRKDNKQNFSIGSVRDPKSGREVSLKEAIDDGLIDIGKGLYQSGEEAGKGAAGIPLTEAIWNGGILLQASTASSDAEAERKLPVQTNFTNSARKHSPSENEPVVIITDHDKEKDNTLEPWQEDQDDEQEVDTLIDEIKTVPVSLMKIILKRSSQPYLIRQVVDPRSKLIISVGTAMKEGILLQGSKHYRNPITGELLTMDDAFARGLLIVDYKKAFDSIKTKEDIDCFVYRGQEGVVLTRLIAVFWVKSSTRGKRVRLHEAINMGLIDLNTGVYRWDRQEMTLAEAVLQGSIKATVLDNSDLESLIRKTLNNLAADQV